MEHHNTSIESKSGVAGVQSYVRPRAMLTKPRFRLSENQKKDIKLAFDLFDNNSTGFIEMKDLRVALRALGFEPRKEELHRMLADVDRDKTGHISFNDFLYLMTKKMSEKDTKEDILKAFRLFDNMSTGAIDLKDLKRVARQLDENLTTDELQEMLDVANVSCTGWVTQEEFLNILKKTTLM